MSTANLLRLIFLAAIWGGSFLFMRIAAPVPVSYTHLTLPTICSV